MERAFPGLRLGWTTSEEGQRTLLADRDAWLAHQIGFFRGGGSTQGRPLVKGMSRAPGLEAAVS